MRKIFFLLGAALFIIGCGSNNETNAIVALEKKLEETKSPQDAEALLEAYSVHMEANPDDTENNPLYLYRAASTMFRMNRFSTATDYLLTALKDYPASPNSGKASELLAEIYDSKLQNPETATTLRQAMVIAYPNYENIAKVKGKIPADATDFATRMKDMTTKMFNDSTGRIDYRIANTFILNSELHALILPDDQENPTYLHRGAETARSIRVFPKAMEFYQWIYSKYPDSDRAPQAMFLHAFTLDNDMKQYEEAKTLYETFLSKYPENDFADDTQFLLENLGKSEEELIKSFEEKAQNQ
jgi:TolA-binding protein